MRKKAVHLLLNCSQTRWKRRLFLCGARLNEAQWGFRTTVVNARRSSGQIRRDPSHVTFADVPGCTKPCGKIWISHSSESQRQHSCRGCVFSRKRTTCGRIRYEREIEEAANESSSQHNTHTLYYIYTVHNLYLFIEMIIYMDFCVCFYCVEPGSSRNGGPNRQLMLFPTGWNRSCTLRKLNRGQVNKSMAFVFIRPLRGPEGSTRFRAGRKIHLQLVRLYVTGGSIRRSRRKENHGNVTCVSSTGGCITSLDIIRQLELLSITFIWL